MHHSQEWSQEWNRETLLQYLTDCAIAYEEVEHGPVYTMAESAALGIGISGCRCKNLLVQGKKGSHRFLVVTHANSPIDLAALGQILGVGRLSLCAPEEMQQALQVAPGALSPLALLADAGAEKVRLLMDERLRANAAFLFHPLVNTSTISIGANDLKKFVGSTGHTVEYVGMPLRQPQAQVGKRDSSQKN